jgi:hypothetical protein
MIVISWNYHIGNIDCIYNHLLFLILIVSAKIFVDPSISIETDNVKKDGQIVRSIPATRRENAREEGM